MGSSAIIVIICAVYLVLCGILNRKVHKAETAEIDTRLKRLEAAVGGVESFDIASLKASVIAKVIEAVDNHPRCPECSCIRHEQHAKFCRSCGYKFSEKQQQDVVARMDDWKLVLRRNSSGFTMPSVCRLYWTCLDCQTQNTEDFEETDMADGRRFIHPLYCGECDDKVAEAIINCKYTDISAVESVGAFGSLTLTNPPTK